MMQNWTEWTAVCRISDLVPESGVAVWTSAGPVALFYLPQHWPALFAVDHFDPFSRADVIARGITGDIKGQPVVASPLYKQHFNLRSGQCLEDESVSLRTYPVLLDGDRLQLGMPSTQRLAETA